MYNEPILHSNQLLPGSNGGILQAMLASIVTIPIVNDDTFIIKGRSGAGTYVTETFTFKTARAAAFEVAIGATAATAQTNLIAAIVADSQLWSAVATTALGQFFAAAYATQFMVYRKSPPSGSPNEDRIYGVQTTAAGIKVVSFTEGGYTTAFSTEASIPATDPGAKRFGFGRVSGPSEGSHRCLNDNTIYEWNNGSSVWMAAEPGSLTVLLSAAFPTLGTPVVLAISGTSARTAALTAGKYLIWSEVACGWRQGTGDPTAVLATDNPLAAGTAFPVTLAAQKLAAITAGASGNLYIVPVS